MFRDLNPRCVVVRVDVVLVPLELLLRLLLGLLLLGFLLLGLLLLGFLLQLLGVLAVKVAVLLWTKLVFIVRLQKTHDLLVLGAQVLADGRFLAACIFEPEWPLGQT
jgi:hypothetical protein